MGRLGRRHVIRQQVHLETSQGDRPTMDGLNAEQT